MRPEPDLYKAFADPESIDRELATARLLNETPHEPPGTSVVYSCTGYLILGVALERIYGVRLGKLFTEVVTRPAGIDDLLFNPDSRLAARSAATEYCAWRKRWIRGDVHDENSYAMGGDGGNAGLFGTARSVMSLLSLFDFHGVVHGHRLLSEEKTRLLCTSSTDTLGVRRAIGFRMQDTDAPMGEAFSRESFGHTGFTGTSVWLDPERGLKVVLLTNRVHAGREQTREAILRFRRVIHSAVCDQWG